MFDGIKLGGINKRIGADVEKRNERCNVIAAIAVRESWSQIDGYYQKIHVVRQPGDGVECADNDHRLDHVGLNLLGLGLSGRPA